MRSYALYGTDKYHSQLKTRKYLKCKQFTNTCLITCQSRRKLASVFKPFDFLRSLVLFISLDCFFFLCMLLSATIKLELFMNLNILNIFFCIKYTNNHHNVHLGCIHSLILVKINFLIINCLTLYGQHVVRFIVFSDL